MNYYNQFLTSTELKQLRLAVIAAMESKKDNANTFELQGVDDVLDKIAATIGESTGKTVRFYSAFIFLASDSTINYQGHSDIPGWHKDGSCALVDGDCYNAWIPVYNDSNDSGIAVITEAENQSLYQNIGDETYPVAIYNKQRQPDFFNLLPKEQAQQADLIIISPHSGKIQPVNSEELSISKYNNAKAGDMAVFKQTEIHGGFHNGGLRVQLSLKFIDEKATLNQKSSNPEYRLFTNMSRNFMGMPPPKNTAEEFATFKRVSDIAFPAERLSQHATLKVDLIKALLS